MQESKKVNIFNISDLSEKDAALNVIIAMMIYMH